MAEYTPEQLALIDEVEERMRNPDRVKSLFEGTAKEFLGKHFAEQLALEGKLHD